MNGARARECRIAARIVAVKNNLPDIVYDVENVRKKYLLNTKSGDTVATVNIAVRHLGKCTRKLTKLFKKAYLAQKRQGLLHVQN